MTAPGSVERKSQCGPAGDLRRARAGHVRLPPWCFEICRDIEFGPALPNKPLATTCRSGRIIALPDSNVRFLSGSP